MIYENEIFYFIVCTIRAFIRLGSLGLNNVHPQFHTFIIINNELCGFFKYAQDLLQGDPFVSVSIYPLYGFFDSTMLSGIRTS